MLLLGLSFSLLLTLLPASVLVLATKASLPMIIPECFLAAKAAHLYSVHIHDIDKNGIIDINDIGPQAIMFGMYWADTNKNGQLEYDEIAALYTRVVPLWARLVSWTVSLFTSKYSIERVFSDCDANGDGVITVPDYEARRYTTCMETCGKAEDVFNYVGIKFGIIP